MVVVTDKEEPIRCWRWWGARAAAAATFTAVVLGSPVADAAAEAVPGFDPTADVVLDMNAGTDRPEDHEVLAAFERQYEEFDRCVLTAKRGRDTQLPGDVDVQVLLDPRGLRPLGINATLPVTVKSNRRLLECLRAAIASAPYPAYDGPPVVVEFNFELDPR